ncbi:MAG: tetratricopeptide repeat protein [Planctomycetaceae bacterium]|nr:tetratricopeptide repeat protein [Planctomycetaceae bacterium]
MTSLIKTNFFLVLLFFQCCCSAQEDVSTRATILLEEGDLATAQKLLEDHLKNSANDHKARLLLGRVLNYIGENKESLSLLHQGIEANASDEVKVDLWLAIGTIELQLGEDGAYMERIRGSEVYNPGLNEAKDRKFRAEHLEKAKQAFEAVLALAPDHVTALPQYARALQLAGDPTGAIAILKKLQDRDPANPRVGIQLANCYIESKDAANAAATLEQYLTNWPRNANALEMLADLYQESGRTEDADTMRKQSEFYSRVPEFAKLEYTPENAELINDLSEPATIEALLKESRLESSRLLAIYCWWHPHNSLENRAFEELGNRQDTTQLLEDVFNNANSSCTIRGAARQLARQKSPMIFDRLVELLPNDLMSMGYEMEIANAFDVLGDPRAVEHLAKFLSSDPKVEQNGPSMIYSVPYAKARAIMALGAFDTPESRQALEQVRADERLGLCGVAALYRLTKGQEYLDQLKQAVAEKKDEAVYPVYRLSEILPEDDEIKLLLEHVKKARNGR